jgi:hypothetical protein
VVPVVWSVNDRLDGFYTVRSIEVSGYGYSEDPTGRWSATLTRVGGGYAAAFVELFAARALRTNTCSVTTAVARPTIVHPFSEWSSIGLKDPINVDGGQMIRVLGSVDLDDVLPVDIRYRVAPADYLVGAATIEREVGGVWYPQSGVQLPEAAYTSFRLSNGFVRVTLSATGVVVQAATGTGTYGTAYTFDLRTSNSGAPATIFGYKDPVAPRVLRNDPAAVAVQWSFAAADDSYVVEMLLRRGSSHVECQMYMADGSNVLAPDIRISSGTSAATTAGIAVRSAPDANGHSWFLASALVSTVLGNTIGRILTADTKFARFGLGIGGGSGSVIAWSNWQNYYVAEVYEDVFAT